MAWDINQTQSISDLRRKRRVRRMNAQRIKQRLSDNWRIVRFQAELRVENRFGEAPKVYDGSIFIHEINGRRARLFCKEQIKPGTAVTLHILGEQGESVFVKARVDWCVRYLLNSKIICSNPMYYRAGLWLDIPSPVEKRGFIRKLRKLKFKHFFKSSVARA